MPQYHNDLTLSRFFKTKESRTALPSTHKGVCTDTAMGHSDDSLQTWVDVPASVRGRLSHRHTLIHLSVVLTPQGQQPPDVQSNPGLHKSGASTVKYRIRSLWSPRKLRKYWISYFGTLSINSVGTEHSPVNPRGRPTGGARQMSMPGGNSFDWNGILDSNSSNRGVWVHVRICILSDKRYT